MSTVAMDVSPCDSPVRKYVEDYYSMRLSNYADRSDPVSLSSMGMVDLGHYHCVGCFWPPGL